ncbi:hypothetical protein [Streptomyces filamentosus]|uniref:hypothetical protein n=1 Tax=Streptomyces filamentosus TaxID=67294 RepID=UPI00123B5453|nr:hypothetical protein [Streptomyces filamentosus]KAA6215967.1 hypothetical protein CP979_02610 [Streptomyces filamentosus]
MVVVAARTGSPAPPACGSVAAMNARRIALPLLAALLAGGCTALPQPPAPSRPAAPETAPPAFAPADRRPPSALPERPVEAEPREELADTEEGEGGGAREPGPASVPVRPRADAASSPQPGGHGTPGSGGATVRAPKSRAENREAGSRAPEARAPRSRTTPRTSSPSRTRAAAPTRVPAPRPADGQVPEMRSLCREAARIEAPMGAAELCRDVYGR